MNPVCLNADGAVANGGCEFEGMTDDGKYILFYSVATNLTTGATGASYIAPNPLY